MGWINPYGLAVMAVIMVPNIAFAVRRKGGFENRWKKRWVELLEQIGRFACFALMIVMLPGTGFGSDEAFVAYLIIDGGLTLAYCGIWMVCFRRNSVFRALALSILPSAIFLLSGMLLRSIPLIAASAVFAPCHIAISYHNAVLAEEEA